MIALLSPRETIVFRNWFLENNIRVVQEWARVANSRQQSCKLAIEIFYTNSRIFSHIIREFVADFYVSSERII